jgi:intracellular sulfur oxidation DsrE/DsrF family protein
LRGTIFSVGALVEIYPVTPTQGEKIVPTMDPAWGRKEPPAQIHPRRRSNTMKRNPQRLCMNLCVAFCLVFVVAGSASAEEYAALKGLKTVKAVFDVRAGSAKSAALQLKLIQETFQDRTLTAITKKPAFVVVFIGPSVKLISKNREGFPPEDQKVLDEIAGTVSAMAKSGIRLEICLFAAKVLGVNPGSVLPEIKQVGNGWISLIGYQEKGYSLVPAY